MEFKYKWDSVWKVQSCEMTCLIWMKLIISLDIFKTFNSISSNIRSIIHVWEIIYIEIEIDRPLSWFSFRNYASSLFRRINIGNSWKFTIKNFRFSRRPSGLIVRMTENAFLEKKYQFLICILVLIRKNDGWIY